MAAWAQLGVHCSSNERRADEASRDVEAWLKCYYMRDHLGQEYAGTITGVATFGLFVQLESLFVEGMIHISELGGDYYQYDESRQELRGERTGIRYRLTDRVHVLVSRVDLDARRIEFSLVKPNGDRNGVAGVGVSERDRFSYESGRVSRSSKSSATAKKSSNKTLARGGSHQEARRSNTSSVSSQGGASAKSSAGRGAKKTTAAKAGRKPKKSSNAKSKGHELSVRKGRR
jgi:ribonuclease R